MSLSISMRAAMMSTARGIEAADLFGHQALLLFQQVGQPGGQSSQMLPGGRIREKKQKGGLCLECLDVG